jgi:hypothetical protein
MKWLLRIGLGVVLLFVLLYGVVLLRSLIPVTVGDQGLRPARATIPEASNAFGVLQEAGTKVWWPGDQAQQVSDLARNTNWDNALANAFLAKNREALAGWDAAAKLPDLHVPEVHKVDDLMPYLADWKRLAQVAEVRENALFRAGNDKEAFDQVINHIRLGRRMQDAGGPLICYLVGVAVSDMGLRQVPRWTGKTHLTPRQLKDYISQLELLTDRDGAALANTFKAEYQGQLGTLDALRKGQILNPDTGRYYSRPTLLWPTFNLSKTKALFAQATLMMVKAAPQHYGEAKLPDLGSHRPGPVAMILSGNCAGQVMYYLMMPAAGSIVEKKSHADAQLQATRAILALRAYQLTHGRLPTDLAALVPEFLDKVPVDDFDGQPLRYSPDRKIVYSVGKNLKDDGGDDRGSEADSSQRHLDMVCRFDF